MRISVLKTSVEPSRSAYLLLAARLLSRNGVFDFGNRACTALEIESELLQGEPMVVLLAMPRPPCIGEKSQDVLLRSEEVRFLLSHPAAFPLFVTFDERCGLDAQLVAWIRQSPQGLLEKHVPRSSGTPMYWAFITMEELQNRSEAAKAAMSMVSLCASYAVFDPTGIRAFFEFVACTRRGHPVEEPVRRPPWFALAIDDDGHTARRHAYFLRRLGYSTFVVNSESAWQEAITTKNWCRGIRYDMVITDDILPWEGGPDNIGFKATRNLDAVHKIYVTGRRTNGGDQKTGVVLQKPICDVQQLIFAYEGNESSSGKLWNILNVLEESAFYRAELTNHQPVVAANCEIARKLMIAATRLEERGLCWESAVYFFDAYRFYLGNDPTAAAEAFCSFQAIEVRELAAYYIDEQETKLWEHRNKEIRRALHGTFPPQFLREPSWWMARTMRRLQSVLKENLASGDLIEQAERAIRDAVAELYHKEDKWVRWITKKIANSLAEIFASVQMTFVFWVLLTTGFAAIYLVFAKECPAPLGKNLPMWLRSAGAALAGGTGLFSPQDIGVCVAGDNHLLLGLGQRVISLLLMARLVDLFLTKARGRA